MNIRKVVAGSLIAACAGVTLAAGVLGATTLDQGLEPFVTTDTNALSSPKVVVGDTANPIDVVGAADLAAALTSQYAITTETIPASGASASVTGGVDVASTSTKIYLGDTLTKSGLKTTITKTNLPSLLAQATFYDSAGTGYTYNQYINFGAGTVTFGTSGGDLSDPKLYLDTGTSTTTPLYTTSVVFNKLLNLSHTDVRGQTIALFGKTYTIGSASSYDGTTNKLVLFGGAGNSQTVSEGEEVTMTSGGTEHKVEVVGVSGTTVAVISIDGTSKEVTEGNTYTVAGVDVYIDSIYWFGKETQVSKVKLSLGSSKLTLENGATVKTGQSEDTVDGTLVTLTGTANQGISKLEIAVTAKDTSYDSILAGSQFSDPVFSGLKVAFGGLNTGTTDTITIDNSGSTAATVKFTDYRGNEKSMIWAYTGTSSFSPDLNDTSTRAYHVIEGETVAKNDYVFLAPSQESEFGHIFQYTTASSIGSSGAYIELKDVMSTDVSRIYLTDTGNAQGTFYVDGQAYYVKNVSTSAQTFKFTWGAGASAGVVGTYTTAFPLIKGKNGEYITFFDTKAMGSTAGIDYQLPGSTSATTITNNTYTASVGRLTYTFTNSTTTTTLVAVNGVNVTAAPAVLIYEEKGKNTAEADVQDAVLVTIADGSGTGVDVTVQAPTLTAATSYSGTQQTDNSVTEYYDRYGTHVKHDTDGQGLVVVSYPDDQATAMVAVGDDPEFTTSGGSSGGTYNKAVPIYNPVSKLASEVAMDTTLNTDLILVGGPCANAVVKSLLNTAWSTEDSCAYWLADAQLGQEGKGMMKIVDNVFGSGKKALIIAGYSGADTRNLAKKAMKPSTFADLTGSEWIGSA